MNKAIIPVIIILLLVAGAGVYLFSKGKTSAPTVENPKTETMTENTSLRDLLALGKSQKCSYSDPDSGSSGTTYISGGKVRADTNVMTNGQAMISHMISDGQTVYVWSDNSQDGFKMTMEQSTETESSSENQATQTEAVDINKKIDYSCSGWATDNNMFSLPENINFMDFSSMMQKSLNY